MITYSCGHTEELGIGDFTSTEYVCEKCADKNEKRFRFFGKIAKDEGYLKEIRIECLKKEMRRAKSNWHCSIPDWTGSGGMVDFWINDDGTYECMDSRIDDQKIREGIRRFAVMDWRDGEQ